MFSRAILALLLSTNLLAATGNAADAQVAIESALRSRDYQHALDLSRKALQLFPDDVRICTMEALALTGLGKREQALMTYRTVLKASPEYLPALEGAAEIEYQRGDPHAIVRLNEILRQHPHDPTAHAMLAVFAFKNHNCRSAADHFQQGMAIVSAQPKALAQFGECLVELKQPANAIPVFTRMAELRPWDPSVRYDLALVEFLSGDSHAAELTLQPLIGEKNPDPDALDLAASVYESLGETPRATELLHQAIVLAPRIAQYYVDFAFLCFTHPSYGVGIDMLTAGLAYLPQSVPLYLARGILRIQAGQYDAGEDDFETADRVDPSQAFGSEAIGLTQLQKSNLDEALATVKARLRVHPDDGFLHYLLAQVMTQKGAQPGTPEFKEAIAEGLRAVTLKPDLNVARNLLSGLYLKSGQAEKATEQCRFALQTDASDQEALYHLIQALRRQGKPSESIDLLRRLATLRAAARDKETSQNRYKLVEVDRDDSITGMHSQ